MPSDLFYPVDQFSGCRKILDTEHATIHDGIHFTAIYTETVSTTVVTVLISTPASSTNKYIHFLCGVETDKAVSWTFSEAPNASGGTSIVSYNNNRTSSITDPVTLTSGVTYVSSGTVLETHIMGSNNPTTKLGGNTNSRNEWLLKQNTLYLIRVVPTTAASIINVILPYYYRLGQ